VRLVLEAKNKEQYQVHPEHRVIAWSMELISHQSAGQSL
jgi:hypothetical protein